MSRLNSGHDTRRIANMALRSPAPRAAVIAMARTMGGNASTMSTTRMRTSSTLPPT